MPTYEYKCTECKDVFEMFQPMSAEAIKECPSCKGLVKRLIGTGAGTIFKGSGFYQTDYKNNSSVTNDKKNNEVKNTIKNNSDNSGNADKTNKKEKEK